MMHIDQSEAVMGIPEIEAMSAVANAVMDLEDDERNRVIRWAAERFGVTLTGGGGRRAPRSGRDDTTDDDLTEEEITAEVPGFEHFAELFAAAEPKTNEDKALVAAYWLQAIQGNDKWQSTALTKELKNLGHAMPNITDALTSNMKKKPQRIIQLQKSGNSRQARKTYKVTQEGLIYVQGMLSHRE
ncbi:MAG: hypothetical protein QOH66_1645 [Actinomycetota bacterium]|jgi:hypothetical protein|nr:hypothetical protein [Actinomycetota bacterium]